MTDPVAEAPAYKVTCTRQGYDKTDWLGTKWGEDGVYDQWLLVADGHAHDPQTTGSYSMEEGEGTVYTPTDTRVFLRIRADPTRVGNSRPR